MHTQCLLIKNIIFCGKTQNINLVHYQNPNFKTEIQNISPAVSLAVKQKDVQPRDVLSLQLLKIIHNERQKTMQMQKTAIPKKWFSYFIPLVIGFIVVIGIAGVLTKDIQNRSKDNTSTPTIAFSPSKQPISSSAVNKSDYTIIVLNGSGKAGAATKTKELLENEGFNVVRIGNAENHNYKKTLVGFKKTVPSELILLLDKVLKSVYDFSTGTKLEKNSESDILIIIGKN